MNAREKESAGEGVREGDQKRIARAREGVGVREHHARRARMVGFEWDDDAGARPVLDGARCFVRVCARACAVMYASSQSARACADVGSILYCNSHG